MNKSDKAAVRLILSLFGNIIEALCKFSHEFELAYVRANKVANEFRKRDMLRFAKINSFFEQDKTALERLKRDIRRHLNAEKKDF